MHILKYLLLRKQSKFALQYIFFFEKGNNVFCLITLCGPQFKKK